MGKGWTAQRLGNANPANRLRVRRHVKYVHLWLLHCRGCVPTMPCSGAQIRMTQRSAHGYACKEAEVIVACESCRHPRLTRKADVGAGMSHAPVTCIHRASLGGPVGCERNAAGMDVGPRGSFDNRARCVPGPCLDRRGQVGWQMQRPVPVEPCTWSVASAGPTAVAQDTYDQSPKSAFVHR